MVECLFLRRGTAMTSRHDEIDPRYDPAYQRGGGGDVQFSRHPDAPPIVEISDVPAPNQAGAVQAGYPDLEQRQRRYRMAAWGLAAGLVAAGVFFLFADAMFPQDLTAAQPNWSGYPVEPWPQKLRMAAPDMLMLGILTAVVQVFLEQVQTFRLRTGR